MKTITKSVIKLSELPKHLQSNKIFNGHKLHTYAEFHIDYSEEDELSLWLIENYPTITMKISFLIHINIQQEKMYSEEEALRFTFYCNENYTFHNNFYIWVSNTNFKDRKTSKELFEQFKNK